MDYKSLHSNQYLSDSFTRKHGGSTTSSPAAASRSQAMSSTGGGSGLSAILNSSAHTNGFMDSADEHKAQHQSNESNTRTPPAACTSFDMAALDSVLRTLTTSNSEQHVQLLQTVERIMDKRGTNDDHFQRLTIKNETLEAKNDVLQAKNEQLMEDKRQLTEQLMFERERTREYANATMMMQQQQMQASASVAWTQQQLMAHCQQQVHASATPPSDPLKAMNAQLDRENRQPITALDLHNTNTNTVQPPASVPVPVPQLQSAMASVPVPVPQLQSVSSLKVTKLTQLSDVNFNFTRSERFSVLGENDDDLLAEIATEPSSFGGLEGRFVLLTSDNQKFFVHLSVLGRFSPVLKAAVLENTNGVADGEPYKCEYPAEQVEPFLKLLYTLQLSTWATSLQTLQAFVNIAHSLDMTDLNELVIGAVQHKLNNEHNPFDRLVALFEWAIDLSTDTTQLQSDILRQLADRVNDNPGYQEQFKQMMVEYVSERSDEQNALIVIQGYEAALEANQHGHSQSYRGTVTDLSKTRSIRDSISITPSPMSSDFGVDYDDNEFGFGESSDD